MEYWQLVGVILVLVYLGFGAWMDLDCWTDRESTTDLVVHLGIIFVLPGLFLLMVTAVKLDGLILYQRDQQLKRQGAP